MLVEDVAVAGMFEGEDKAGHGTAGHEIEDKIAEVELEELLKSLEPVLRRHLYPSFAVVVTVFQSHASCGGVA